MGATQSKSGTCVLETPRGSLKGLELSDQSGRPVYRRFTKVPYARPPVGSLRWRRPQPLPSDFSFDASAGSAGDYTDFGPICPQPEYGHIAAILEGPDAAPEPDNTQSEDCLYLNIWVPAGAPPQAGWPVQFYIHGGWLQMGDAMQNNACEPFDLLATTDTPRIIVSPTYRLNLFGFLSGSVLSDLAEDVAPGNYGFWDQRAALEWTHSHIKHFSGDPDNITVGGLSAGANSTFFQLYHDGFLPPEERIIKRAYLWSNAVGIQPNSTDSPATDAQFDELCGHFSIPTSGSASSKLSQLRSIPAADLVSAIFALKMHTFRATTDSSFIPRTFLRSIHDGSFTTKLVQNGVSIMLGEVCDEALLYRLVNPPATFAGLRTQLQNYYPASVAEALLEHYELPDHDDGDADKWADAYARAVADCQVHAVIRGFAHALLSPPVGADAMPLSRVHRYRIEWRATSLDQWLDPAVGVCHAADEPIWWCSGWRAGYDDEDKRKTAAFLEPFGRFLRGDPISSSDWGTASERQVRRMDKTGNVEVVDDEHWERGLAVWNTMRDAQLAKF